MARMLGHPPPVHCSVNSATEHQSKAAQSSGRTWYFSKEEIENHSPSRTDGIDYMQESLIRDLYCSFLQDLATKLKVGSGTLATALMLCHRFFMRQSLAKNDWQRIKKRDVQSQQRELILDGEQLILVTIAFDINIEHPYEPLMTALKMLKLSENHVARTAWDYVNNGLRTTLCLQYKPHYLAAASLFLAAKYKNVRLPMDGENVWWLKFNVLPSRLQEAIKDMHGLIKQSKVQKPAPRYSKTKTPNSEPKSSGLLSSQSCIVSGSTVTHDHSADTGVETGKLPSNHLSFTQDTDPGDNHLITGKQASEHPSSDCSSATSVVEDSEAACWTSARDSKPETGTGYGKLDVARLREAFQRTRSERNTNKRQLGAANNDGDGDAWVTREIERGVDQEYSLKQKRQQV